MPSTSLCGILAVHPAIATHESVGKLTFWFSPAIRLNLFGLLLMAAFPVPGNSQTISAENPQQIFSAETFEGLGYRFLKPKNIDPQKRYPLVLFLHGAGERGDDNVAQLKHGAAEFVRSDRRERFPAFVVMPQCPADHRWVESAWDLPSGRGKFPDEPSSAMKRALALVDHLVGEHPVDAARLYVAGLSMGGQGTWYAAAASPRRFAAMVEICGGGDPTWADRYSGIPLWVLHGAADPVVPISRGREMIVALTQAGHHPELRYTEYPGVGHDSWTQTLSREDVFEWLFRQSKDQD